jgi:flagellar hook-associated protein 2
MAGFQVSGLVSGSLNWQTIVDQLIQLDSAPITKLETQQSTNTTKINALDALSTKLTSLQTSINALNDGTIYNQRSASSSTSGSTWSINAGSGTGVGSYTVAVSQLATAAYQKGETGIGSFLDPSGDGSGVTIGSMPTAMAVTAGTFTVNGKQVTVGLSDTLKSVLDQVSTATGGKVTARYDNTNDKLVFSSTDGNPVMLGASNDTSNFVNAMQLGSANNATTLTSSSRLGTVSTSSPLANAHFGTALSNLDSSGNGSLTINGVSISYNANTDSLSAVISRINASSAGVTASYDASRDQMTITNSNTGDTGISMSDGANGNLLAALKVNTSGATFTRGANALFTVNGGATRSSSSNTLSSTALGITGLSVTVKDATTQTLNVTASTSDATSKINSFVSAYNAVQDYIDQQTKITSASGKVTTSTLTDNREVQNWARKLRSLAFGAIGGSGTVKQLNDLGIDFVAGSNDLQVKDSTKLDSALKNNSADVTNLFTSTTGFVANYKSYLTTILGDGTKSGSLQYQTDNLSKANKDMDNQIEQIQNRLDEEKSTLTTQFLAMQTYQSKANSIMATLSKSFA